jgi:acyl-coenzyme A thioesterase PaaI-like protein
MDLSPNFDAEPGWRELVPAQAVAGRSFVSGDPQGDRLRVRYFVREDGSLAAKVWFGPGAEGPPGHAHGGSLAAVLDETMGAVAWLAGHVAVAADLHVEFRRMVPLGTVVLASTWLTTVDGRKVRTAGTLRSLDGAITYCEADGLFIEMDAGRFGDMF